MKIVIAPDSFKGSISAEALCDAIETGIKAVCPDAIIHKLPLSDGGEGLVSSLIQSCGGTYRHAMVHDPLGREIKARYGLMDDGQTAVIEMAEASGLTLLQPEERNPMRADSYGTGQLIQHALNLGCRRFVIGLGGSATVDGGMGMLRALGMRWLDAQGNELEQTGGQALLELQHYDRSRLDERLRQSSFVIASDVTNPLCGPNGAAAIFGPQKGADAEQVSVLDEALARYAQCVEAQEGIRVSTLSGAGAAGGMGAAFAAFLGAKLASGIDYVMEATRLSEAMASADLVITGEGKLDQQTLSGKVIAGVCQLGQRHQTPVVALCGSVSLSLQEMKRIGLVAGFSIVPGPCSLEEAMKQAPEWAAERTMHMMRIMQCFANGSCR
ncbi:glycerate kinase [Paenibacillus sp. PL2-23]|uniref:glycerate kinase n=1 Tax=Paenibacillus sp. PL2-23 TaxID=2100729 RepID=UPI0030F506D7